LTVALPRSTKPAQPAVPTPQARVRRARLPIDSSLFFKLVRVVNLTARPFVETLSRSHKLSLNEWRAMVVLASHPGATASDIAEHTGLDKMSVSRAVQGLSKGKRVSKQLDPSDARRTQLGLTTSGQALFEAIGVLAAEREAALFKGISAAERRAMAKTIDRLAAALEKT
jgi:DNA-binding MarR family transcriptional regulator